MNRVLLMARPTAYRHLVPAGYETAPIGHIAETKEYYRVSRKDLTNIPLDEIMLTIADLEREMKQAARALDFEHAAQCRDEITRIKKLLPGVKW